VFQGEIDDGERQVSSEIRFFIIGKDLGIRRRTPVSF
jgi:hypothetical protein